jgi:hypothetical protein
LFDTTGTATDAIEFDLNGFESFGPAVKTAQVFSITNPFSLTNVAYYEISGRTTFDVTGGGTTLTPAPAPASLLLGLMGGIPLVAGAWLRRRRQPQTV